MAAAVMDAEGQEKVKVDGENWFLHHPKYTEMMSYGFEDKLQLRIAFLSYLDLCEAKNWWNVEIHPCHKLGMVFISGKQNKKGDLQLVLPISANTPLSNERLHEFTANVRLSDDETEGQNVETEPESESKAHCVVLAVSDSDSTTVYYRISDSLIPPDPPKQTLVQEVSKGKRKKRKAVFVAREPDEPVTDEENWDDEL
ncbi:tRNA-splicing endonuclease subunit Sen15-like isoform X1 [Ptychodera flava]|uniref:tRNA-splicing endonuclease subunit Sen15-like isoform X1 n=1 Tax=Ptychodera flava TaxID=63121 RepID=UPI003969D500